MINNKAISIIIPAYNEADSIIKTITDLKENIEKLPFTFEIIVVDDASTDQTPALIKDMPGLKIITQPYNKGYGAALKSGAKVAQSDWLLFFDADGQHKPQYISTMLPYMDRFDLISGQRVGYQGPLIRQPGKKAIHLLAIFLLGRKISDFNCGLRLIKKEHFLRFSHILPNGFSCSTTIIFAFYKEKLDIKFVPIQIEKRGGGKSMVKPKEAFIYFMLIIRLIILFSPLRFFLPISLLLFVFGAGLFIYDASLQGRISVSTVLILITSILIFFFGLIADQIAAIRREIHS